MGAATTARRWRSASRAVEFFSQIPKIHRRLQTLHDVGLDYIRLGQPATTLSGGEAQRIKLATELSKVATGDTLYILDEPTTGLHFADVERLLGVLDRLVEAGNTVLVIEHNLDVIKSADQIIDLGPEGGDAGGELVATGTPEQVAGNPDSYTGRFLTKLVEPSEPTPKPKRTPKRRKREPVAA
jgi:excinuclease ABC subunit A